MPRYVAILDHSPEVCPDSNKAVRAQNENLASQLPAALQKYNVKMISDNVLSPTHKVILVLEASNIEAIRDLFSEAGLTQWNNTVIYPSLTIQESTKTVAEHKPIF